MADILCNRELLVSVAKFSGLDLDFIKQCRHDYTRLGFAYQLAHVRLFNIFPNQKPFEANHEILAFVSLQLGLDERLIDRYSKRQPTISEHQESIRNFLGLRLFNSAVEDVESHAFKLSYSLEQTGAITARLREYLKTNYILEPALDTLQRIIQTQRQTARDAIYDQIYQTLPVTTKQPLDQLLVTENNAYSILHSLKQPPGLPSPSAFNKLAVRIEIIENTGALAVDLSWLNNNFQRSLARFARQCTIFRLRQLKPERRYAVLVCFLNQLYQDTFDSVVEMYDKLVNKVYNRADNEIDDFMKKRRRQVRLSLVRYKVILDVLLDKEINEVDILPTIFDNIDPQLLKTEQEELDLYLNSQYHDSFHRVVARYSYIRQFTPALCIFWLKLNTHSDLI